MTNKALLEEIHKEQRTLAKQQLQIAANLSTFMNEQSKFNQRVSILLNSDPATNTKGVVENLIDIKDRVLDLEVKNKITAGKVAIGIIILSAVGGVVLKVLTFLD